MTRQAKIAIFCGALTVVISMGVRQSFGLFLQPVSHDLEIGRRVFSFAIALQNLIFGLPLLALVADRFGARWVVLAGGFLYGAGFLLLPAAETPLDLYLVLGLLKGLALSSITYVVVLGAVARVVPQERRGSAFGIVTAAGSCGTFALVPGIHWLISNFGWQVSFTLLSIPACMIIMASLGFPRHLSATTAESGRSELTFSQTLRRALRHSGYWLLTGGFFVCGFHVSFIATHLPAFLTDSGLSPATSAASLALIGLFNIVGSYLFGFLGDRYRKKYLLSILYFSRALVISLFILFPLSDDSALIFSGAIGLLWLATVPLTSGTVAQIFGARYLSTLYGIVFFSHQLGSFAGIWLGGIIHDSTGSYVGIWIAAIALGLLAALLHLPIADKPTIIEK